MRFFSIAGLFSLISLASVTAKAQNAVSFMPENDLWKQDRLEAASNISETVFKQIVQAGIDLYKPLADKNSETLIINPDWNNSEVNANALREDGQVEINMYGGMARRPEITPDSFTIVLCHELGHAYGGTPYIHPERQMAAEGQADYSATKVCYDKMASKLSFLAKIKQPSQIIAQKCNAFGANTIKYATCVGKLEGGLGLGKLLATLMEDSAPRYETPDTTVVEETLLSYPDTVQCRVDTYLAGALNLARPACWFKN